MNRSTLIIIACGFFFALFAAAAVQMLSGSHSDDTAEKADTTWVLVAARDLQTGDELTEGATQWASWPRESAFTGSIVREGEQTAADALKGRVSRGFAAGEPMLKSGTIDGKFTNFIAANLQPGRRAVSINVNEQSSVAGFVSPGDYVDVLLTYDVDLPADDTIRKAALPVVDKLATETVLENLRVLATDQDSSKKDDTVKPAKTITVEVTPAQAEQLTLAGKMGNLSLVLRGLGDTATMADAKTRAPTTTDVRVSGVMREILKGENKTGSLNRVVRVYSGTRVDNVEVRPYSQ